MSSPGSRARVAGMVMLALAAGCTARKAQPLPDAGVAVVEGVTLERVVAGGVEVTVQAPSAELALDGQSARLLRPTGRWSSGDGGSPVEFRAARLDVDLAGGRVAMEDVTLRDAEGRQATSPRVSSLEDGGGLWAAPPVEVAGPNWKATARGGARFVPGAEARLDLHGPVEAEARAPSSVDGAANPADGGPRRP